MAKSKPKARKQTATKPSTKGTNYQTLSIILACALVASLCGLVYCATRMKTAEEQEYLDVHEELFTRVIKEVYQQDDHWQVCDLDSTGISQDGDVMGRFWCQSYNTETHEPIGDREYRTVYFQHRGELDGKPHYAWALGD